VSSFSEMQCLLRAGKVIEIALMAAVSFFVFLNKKDLADSKCVIFAGFELSLQNILYSVKKIN